MVDCNSYLLDGAVLVGTLQLIEIKVSSEECTYDLSDCIFFLEASFSGNKSGTFYKHFLIKGCKL